MLEQEVWTVSTVALTDHRHMLGPRERPDAGLESCRREGRRAVVAEGRVTWREVDAAEFISEWHFVFLCLTGKGDLNDVPSPSVCHSRSLKPS